MKQGLMTLEWEEQEKEIDRAWYDADEDSNIRYGGTSALEDFLQGPSEEEEKAATEELLRRKK